MMKNKKEISIETIKENLGDKDQRIRSAAMNACEGRNDIPLEIIEKGLKDENWGVRESAMKVYESRNEEAKIYKEEKNLI